MSNANIDALLRAVGQASLPFKSVEAATASLNGDIRNLNQRLRDLHQQMADVESFQRTRQQLARTETALKNARQESRALADTFHSSKQPAAELWEAMAASGTKIRTLNQHNASLQRTLESQRNGLEQAGISTRNLTGTRARLNGSIRDTTTQLERQHEVQARVMRQQAQINAVKQRYQAGQARAERIGAATAPASKVASAGVAAGKALLQPGYAFAEKQGAVQRTLGLRRDAPEMQALRDQARTSDATTAVDAASAQLVLAKGGSDAAAIASLMPLVRSMTLTNQDSQETNAGVVMTAVQSGSLDQLRAQYPAPASPPSHGASDSLGGDIQALQAAYESISIDIFAGQESSLRKLVQTAAGWLQSLREWIADNQTLTSTLGIIAAAVIGVAGFIGSIGAVVWPVMTGINIIIAAAGILGTVFSIAGGIMATALGAISLPIVGIGAAIVGVAMLLYKYWEPVSAFLGGLFSGIAQAVKAAFGPQIEMFGALGEAIGAIWQWLSDLLEPVQMGKEALNSFRDVGVLFGQALADALLLPLKAFNTLRSGIDWVLEKLGVINKQRVPVDEAAEKAKASIPDATPASDGEIKGITRYQTTAAPISRNSVDQSQHHYTININGTGLSEAEVARTVRSQLESYEQQRQSRRQASMQYDV